MPFENPAVGGETLVRPSIRSPNYQQGLMGWAINRDGSADFSDLTVRGTVNADNIIYKGNSLDTLLSEAALGQQGVMYYNTGGTTRTVAAGADQLMIQTQFVYQGNNRQYYMHMSSVRAQMATAPNNMWWTVRHCPASRGNVALTDPSTWVGEHRFIDAAQWDGLPIIFKEIAGILDSGGYSVGQSVNFALAAHPNGAQASFFPGDDWLLGIIDMGLRQPIVGVDLWTAPAGVSKTFKTFQISPIDSQSYQGGGAATQASGSSNEDRMYYGPDNYYTANGNMKSLAWYNKTSTAGGNGLGSIADMAGIAASDISYLDAYFNTAFWYDISGGTLLIGDTNSGVNHSSYPGGSSDKVEQFFGSRGAAQWVSLKGSQIATDIINGNFTGLQLGPGKDSSSAWYGYVLGASHGNPTLRAGYYK